MAAVVERQGASLKWRKFVVVGGVVLFTTSSIANPTMKWECTLKPLSWQASHPEICKNVPLRRTSITFASLALTNDSMTPTPVLSTFQGVDNNVAIHSSNSTDINTTTDSKNHDASTPFPSSAPVITDSSSIAVDIGDLPVISTRPVYNRTERPRLVGSNTRYAKMPHNQFCSWLKREQSNLASLNDTQQRVLYQLTYDCNGISQESTLGTGNWLQFIYGFRILAAFSQANFGKYVDLQLSCQDGHSNLDDILPWLMGHFSSEATKKYMDQYYSTVNQSLHVPCRSEILGAVGWMVPFLRFDLRRMAIAVVGLPEDKEHPAHSWIANMVHQDEIGQSYYSELPHHWSKPSLLSNITLDEVVIHFRCGDVMYADFLYFRFLKFIEYSSRIDPNVKSIGIVTQPFGSATNSTTESSAATATATGKYQNGYNGTVASSQARAVDVADPVRTSTCQRVVYALVGHLESRFPQARVVIHNGPQETVALAYARLVMAKQAFSAPDSTFSIFPVLASFGTGYHMSPTRGIYTSAYKNGWLHSVKDHIQKMDAMSNNTYGRLELMDIRMEDCLFAKQTYHMREDNETTAADNIVQWFVNESLRFSIQTA